MAIETLYGATVLVSTDWTNPNNALGAPDAVSATATTVGSPISLDIGAVGGSGEIDTSSVLYGATWTALHGTTGRTQSALIELLDGNDTVLASFTTDARNTAVLALLTATYTPATPLTRAQTDALRVRLTPQEGGGMPGTYTHYVDSVRAEVTYEAAALGISQYRMRVGGVAVEIIDMFIRINGVASSPTIRKRQNGAAQTIYE